jgi:hypothetical protein
LVCWGKVAQAEELQEQLDTSAVSVRVTPAPPTIPASIPATIAPPTTLPTTGFQPRRTLRLPDDRRSDDDIDVDNYDVHHAQAAHRISYLVLIATTDKASYGPGQSVMIHLALTTDGHPTCSFSGDPMINSSTRPVTTWSPSV